METNEWLRELRVVVRSLGRAKGFTAIAVVTLALGIATNVSMFSVFDAVLLNPLPYEDSGRLVMLWANDAEHGIAEAGFSYPTYVDWRESNHVFEDVAASLRDSRLEVRIGEYLDRLYVNFATSNLFSVLGVEPTVGRGFTQQEDEAGAAVAVVSAGFAERFGGGEAAIGETFEIQGQTYEIVGVMGERFRFPHPETVAWIPWPTSEPWGKFRSIREMDALRGIARLRPGVTAEQAERDLDAIGALLTEKYPPSKGYKGYDANVVPLLEQITGADLPRLLRLMLAAVALVFLIACVNVMNLILVRNEARATELAVRSALGASGWALRRIRIVEAAVLAALGLGLGLALASALVPAIVALAPAGIPRIDEVRFDWNATAFAVGLALLALAAVAIVPTKATRTASATRGLTSSGASRRLQAGFVCAQAAIALVLLCGVSLFVKSFLTALEFDPGYSKENVLLATVDYREGKPDAVHGELLRRIRAYPGVETVGAATRFEIVVNPDATILVEGRAEPESFPLTGDGVTPEYFRAMGVRLIRGRAFEKADLGKDLAVINETMARQFWVDEDPLGSTFQAVSDGGRSYEVVGVVGDMRRQGIEREPIAQMFQPVYTPVMTVAIRGQVNRAALGDWIQQQYAEIAPGSLRPRVTTIEQMLENDLAPRRFYTLLLAGFAFLALTLTAVGLFGLMAYVVERRTREIGVRVAVGAQPHDILALMMGEGARLVLIGCGFGLIGVLWMSDVLSGLLFETRSRDVVSLTAATGALVLTGLLACYLPSRRAASADPVRALRSE